MTDAEKLSYANSRMLPRPSDCVNETLLSSPSAYSNQTLSSTSTSGQSKTESNYSIDEDGDRVWPDGYSPQMSMNRLPLEPASIEAPKTQTIQNWNVSELGPSLRALLKDSSRDHEMKLAPIRWKPSDASCDSQTTLHSQSESQVAYNERIYAAKVSTKRNYSEVADQYGLLACHPNREQANSGYYHVYPTHGAYYYPYPAYYQHESHYHHYYSGYYNAYTPARHYPPQKPPKQDPTPSLPVAETEKPKRQKKDPNAPKHPMSAFLFYLSAMRKKYTEKYPDYGVGMISKVIAAEWKELTDAQKEPYVKQSDADKSRYSREMHVWHEKMYRLPCK
jgi:hypothetical protein